MRFVTRARSRYGAASAARSLAALALLSISVAAVPAFADGGKPDAAKPAAVQTAEKFTLLYKAKEGQVRKGRVNASFNVEFGGEKATFEIKQSDKATYTKVHPNGDLTYENTTESSEVSLNGEKMPDDDEKPSTDTVTITKFGLMVSVKSTKEDKDELHLGARLSQATRPVYPDKPVGVGDKWTQEYKANDEIGTKAAKADFEILGEEKVGDTAAVKIKITYAENGSGGLACKGTFLVEKESGDTLSADYDVENIPFPGPGGADVLATGKVKEQRAEGGPLPNAKNVAVKEEPKKEKTIDDVVKDLEKFPGIFTVYRKKEVGKDTVYLEIPEDRYGKLLMLQTTASSGTAENLIAGDPISDILFTFTKNPDDKIVLTVPNWYYRADPTTPLGKAVKRSFAEGWLQTFKIEAKQADRKSVLIDVSDFFRSDFAQITQALMGGFTGGLTLGAPAAGYGLDREKTYISQVKNFPDNLVVQTQYHFMRGGRPSSNTALADSRSVPLLVTFNLIALPNEAGTYKPTNGYRPRKADPRVGYFSTEYVSFDDDSREDQTDRWILRWNLQKKDPSAKLSEPVKPITFYLDYAIPTEYRGAVRKGLLLWNKTFERIGFKDAIVVKDLPEDVDHADMRYNVIRWTVTPDGAPRNGVAIALFRPNPLTGEILNASVTVDASWTRFAKLERRDLVDPAVAFQRAAGMDIEALLAAKVPVSDAMSGQLAQAKLQLAQAKLQLAQAKLQLARIASGDPRWCQIGNEKKENAYFGFQAIRAIAASEGNPVREKDYADQLITELVAHEFGHILGLQHNFIGSTELTLDQLKDPKIVKEHGIGASLMDYNAFNISALKTKGVDFYSQAAGTYDKWAIEYGYSPFAASDEKAALKKIASRSSLPGHAFQSDAQVLVGLDPRIVQYDISADPLTYWERMMNLSRFLLTKLDVQQPKTGESYYEFTKAFYNYLGNYSRAAGFASRYVGGLTMNRNHKGDTNERPTTLPMDAAKQKEALRLLNTYVFAPDAFNLPTRYYTHLTPDPFAFSLSQDFPVVDQISGIQRSALTRLFSPAVLRRVQNNEFKEGGNATKALTLPTLFNSVGTNVWAELGAKKSVPTLRRQLQRAHLDTLIDLATKAGTGPEDARMLAWEQLRSLRTRLAAAKTAGGVDEYTRIHVNDSIAKIDRALNMQMTVGGSSGPSMGNLLQMLLGGETTDASTLATPALTTPH
jgi:hypothetical protein